MYKVSEDNALDDIFLEKMRIDHFNKNLKMQNIVKKSFIMNEQSSDNKKRKHEIDSELDKYLSQVKKLEQEKKEVQNSSIFTYKFWKYNISRNLDLFTTLFIDANLLLILYPLTTIKTRIQAQHKYEDVAYFVKNKVLKEPLYKGISQGYISTVIGIVSSFTLAKIINISIDNNEKTKKMHELTKSLLALTFGEMLSSPLRLTFEVKKQILQINGGALKAREYLTKIRQSFMPSLLRDVLFRFNYNLFFYVFLFHRYYLFKLSLLFDSSNIQENNYNKIYYSKITYSDQLTAMIFGSLASLVISNPLDVINTKIVTQQYPKYGSFWECAKTVYREEGYKKLFFSGYWARSSFHCFQAVVVFNLYTKIKESFGEAFID